MLMVFGNCRLHDSPPARYNLRSSDEKVTPNVGGRGVGGGRKFMSGAEGGIKFLVV